MAADAYESYRAFCERLGITTPSREHWAIFSNQISNRPMMMATQAQQQEQQNMKTGRKPNSGSGYGARSFPPSTFCYWLCVLMNKYARWKLNRHARTPGNF